MAGIRIEGDIQKLYQRLHDLSNIDITKINRVLAEAERTDVIERFQNQNAPDGRRWKTSIRAAAESGVTLTKTARLRNSIRSNVTAKGFAVGTNTIYAATHQFGDIGKKRVIKAKNKPYLTFKIGNKWVRKKQVIITTNIPARPFLGFSEDSILRIKRTILKALGE